MGQMAEPKYIPVPVNIETDEGTKIIQKLNDLYKNLVEADISESTSKIIDELKQILGDNLSSNENILQASREGLIYCIENFDKIKTENFIKFVNKEIGFENEKLLSDNTLKAIQDKLSVMLINHYLLYETDRLINLVTDNFGIKRQDLFSGIVSIAIKDRVINDLENGECGYGLEKFIHFINNNKEFFSNQDILSDKDKILHASQNGLAFCIKKGDIEKTKKFIQFASDKFGINKQDLFSDKVLQIVQDKLYEYLYYNEVSNAESLTQFVHNEFGYIQSLFSDKILHVLNERISYHLNYGEISVAEQFIQFVNTYKDFFNNQSILPNPENAFENRLSYLHDGVPNSIEELFQVVENNKEFFNNIDIRKNIRDATESGVCCCLEYGGKSDVEELLNFININKEIFNDEFVFSDKEKILEATKKGEEYLSEYDKEKAKKFIQFVNDEIIPLPTDKFNISE